MKINWRRLWYKWVLKWFEMPKLRKEADERLKKFGGKDGNSR